MNTSTDTTRTNERLTVMPPQEQQAHKNTFKSNTPSKIVLTLIWAICHFVFFFVQQLAEIFAPILLLVGILWKILPSIVHSAMGMVDVSDPQIKDMVGKGSDLIPSSLTIAGHTLTASSLIFDGILLIALTAFCATVTAFLGKRL